MDEILNTTTTTVGSTTVTIEEITDATTSPRYQLYHNGAALLWLLFLGVAAFYFFGICYFFYNRVKR